MFSLRRAPGALPLAFQIREAIDSEELGGNLRRPLEDHLNDEGIGLKTITISGAYAEQSGAVALTPWSREIQVAGSLDADNLVRLIHQQSREFIASFGEGNSPPELYVFRVTVDGAGPKRKEKKKKKKRQKEKPPRVVRVTRYRDRKTGAFVSKAKWERSRRQLRGKPGRFVRVTINEIH